MMVLPERLRISKPDSHTGMFQVSNLTVAAVDGDDWEHVVVVVTTEERTPTWEEMCLVKDLFWEDDVVMQLHPKQSQYVNNHPYALHLWRPKTKEVPTPPKDLVR